jgi:hypothetical protein
VQSRPRKPTGPPSGAGEDAREGDDFPVGFAGRNHVWSAPGEVVAISFTDGAGEEVESGGTNTTVTIARGLNERSCGDDRLNLGELPSNTVNYNEAGATDPYSNGAQWFPIHNSGRSVILYRDERGMKSTRAIHESTA